MGIDDYGLRSEIAQKIKSNTNYLDEINPKEKAWCQKLLNELDTKRPMPVDLLDKGIPLERIMLRSGWKSENTALRYLRNWEDSDWLLVDNNY